MNARPGQRALAEGVGHDHDGGALRAERSAEAEDAFGEAAAEIRQAGRGEVPEGDDERSLRVLDLQVYVVPACRRGVEAEVVAELASDGVTTDVVVVGMLLGQKKSPA
ncbi:MAG: hypothetical protein R2991_16575 [Thermoanaerobaculia bacterium]